MSTNEQTLGWLSSLTDKERDLLGKLAAQIIDALKEIS